MTIADPQQLPLAANGTIAPDAKQLGLQAGGTVVPGRAVYIARPDDEELYRLLKEGEYVNVLSSRQVGKSSLMVLRRPAPSPGRGLALRCGRPHQSSAHRADAAGSLPGLGEGQLARWPAPALRPDRLLGRSPLARPQSQRLHPVLPRSRAGAAIRQPRWRSSSTRSTAR